MADLPINIEDLLRRRTVEGDRIEYKAGWNPEAVLRTLCDFANDFENLGGGYVVLGQDCNEDGEPIFPPVGLSEKQLDTVQKELLGYCNQIQPPYFPILSVQKFEGRKLIVLSAPGGQNRPYKVPGNVTAKYKQYHYFIQRYSSTVKVPENSDDMRELISLTAAIPFDDRHCPTATLSDLKLPLIRDYLRDAGSSLADAGNLSLPELCCQLNINDGGEEFTKPRNVGVLFFSDDPAKFLPGSQIEVVIFPKGPGGCEINEKSFRGPIHEEVRAALRFIQSEVIREKVIKRKDKTEAIRLFNYPFAAVEEAVVNAVYRRSYEPREPVEVRVSPDRIEVVSYPGPDVSIRMAALNGGWLVKRRYRNRRIGNFLKVLDLTEGRCTGIPTMRTALAEIGSPPPRFDTDEARTYFFVELLVHRELPGIAKANEKAYDGAHVKGHDGTHVEPHGDWHMGVHDETHVKKVWKLNPTESTILKFQENTPQPRLAIALLLGLTSRGGHLDTVIFRLRDVGYIELTEPESRQSRNQKYRITEKGRASIVT